VCCSVVLDGWSEAAGCWSKGSGRGEAEIWSGEPVWVHLVDWGREEGGRLVFERGERKRQVLLARSAQSVLEHSCKRWTAMVSLASSPPAT